MNLGVFLSCLQAPLFPQHQVHSASNNNETRCYRLCPAPPSSCSNLIPSVMVLGSGGCRVIRSWVGLVASSQGPQRAVLCLSHHVQTQARTAVYGLGGGFLTRHHTRWGLGFQPRKLWAVFACKPPSLRFSVTAAPTDQDGRFTKVLTAHLALYHLPQRLLRSSPPHSQLLHPKDFIGGIWAARCEILSSKFFSFSP